MRGEEVVIYFHVDTNYNEKYVSWLEHHPHDFFPNVFAGGKQRARLHTGRCWRLYPPNPTLKHTKKPKACSEHRDELERWAADKEFQVVLCPTARCRPLWQS